MAPSKFLWTMANSATWWHTLAANCRCSSMPSGCSTCTRFTIRLRMSFVSLRARIAASRLLLRSWILASSAVNLACDMSELRSFPWTSF